MKIPLRTEVGLGTDDIVLHWGPLLTERDAAPSFGTFVLWPKGRPSQLLLSSCSFCLFSIYVCCMYIFFFLYPAMNKVDYITLRWRRTPECAWSGLWDAFFGDRLQTTVCPMLSDCCLSVLSVSLKLFFTSLLLETLLYPPALRGIERDKQPTLLGVDVTDTLSTAAYVDRLQSTS